MTNNSRIDRQKSNYKLYSYSFTKELHFCIRLSSFTKFVNIFKNKNKNTRIKRNFVLKTQRRGGGDFQRDSLRGMAVTHCLEFASCCMSEHTPTLLSQKNRWYVQFARPIEKRYKIEKWKNYILWNFRKDIRKRQNEKLEIWKAAKRTSKTTMCRKPFLHVSFQKFIHRRRVWYHLCPAKSRSPLPITIVPYDI